MEERTTLVHELWTIHRDHQQSKIFMLGQTVLAIGVPSNGAERIRNTGSLYLQCMHYMIDCPLQ
jgi:hypothetical protein